LLPHLITAPDTPGAGTATAATIFAILASAVIVLGGLAALVRAIWKTATTLRDNTTATQKLTERLDGLAQSVDGRIDRLAERVTDLERAAKP
jgi:predicted PurR-regulated permease PerM